MTFEKTMSALRRAGTAQNRKIYCRHGAHEPLFGVSFANLKAIAKRAGKDQRLAMALWGSGNADARYLATMVAEAEGLGARELDAWTREIDHYVLVELLARNIMCRSPHAWRKVALWTRRKGEWVASAGWATLAVLAMGDDPRPVDDYAPFLQRIEAEIDASPNRVRHEMNGALIAIGTRSDALAKKATAAAKRIGHVEVDHGQTGCKTPDAIPYLVKARAHRKKKQARSIPRAR